MAAAAPGQLLRQGKSFGQMDPRYEQPSIYPIIHPTYRMNRVSEAARRREGLLPKILSPNIRFFVSILRFVAIYIFV